MRTRTVAVDVVVPRTGLVSAVLLWLPELLWITAFVLFAGMFGLGWLLLPAVLIGVKVALRARAEWRQNRTTAQAHVLAKAHLDAEREPGMWFR